MSRRILVPHQGLNLYPLQWKRGDLITRPPREAPNGLRNPNESPMRQVLLIPPPFCRCKMELPHEELPNVKVGAAAERLPHVQGKEKRLRFAGAAMKRYPMSKVRETQVRKWALRKCIRGQTD